MQLEPITDHYGHSLPTPDSRLPTPDSRPPTSDLRPPRPDPTLTASGFAPSPACGGRSGCRPAHSTEPATPAVGGPSAARSAKPPQPSAGGAASYRKARRFVALSIRLFETTNPAPPDPTRCRRALRGPTPTQPPTTTRCRRALRGPTERSRRPTKRRAFTPTQSAGRAASWI